MEIAKVVKTRTKSGGRTKGTPNKRTAALQAQVEKSGITPLAFLLKVMRDSKKPLAMRIDAAKSAAPFVHAKLANIEHSGNGKGGAIVMQMASMDADL